MRHSAVTSVQSCVSPLPTSRRYVAVQLLTRQVLLFSVETKCRLSELNARVCDRMCLQGLQDPALFGLAIPIDGEYVFVDPDNKVSKYAPKAWKSSHEYGLDGSNRPLLQFSFRVKFYVDSHLLLRDRVSRHHYYLQLRENVLVHRQTCGAETCLLLAGWALQADVGDYTETAGGAYFQPVEYFPKWVITKMGVDYILEKTAAAHRDNRSMAKTQAELAYIREASAMEAPHNLHLYRLKRRKAEPAGSVLLGICPNGIELYEEKNLARKLLASFVWTNINNLTFEKKKFEIGALTQKFTFYTGDDEKAKHLFLLCKDIHMFTQTLKERLTEIKQNSYEDRRTTDSSLHFPPGLRAGWEYLSKQGSSTDQRISVISNTSSNTTSGIVSDRTAHSLDESDDDLQVDSLGKTLPPESVESGVDSLTRSRSQLDSNSLRSSQRSLEVEEDTIPAPRCLTESSKAALRPPTAAAQTPAAASAEQARQDSSHSGSAHSSSSQHSAATVRSRFPLVKPPAPPAAQQHLQPPPSCDHTQKHMFSSPTNCCSTCVEDDSVSVCSDEPGSPCVACKTRRKLGKSEQRCTCGGSDGASITSGSTLYARQGDSPRHVASVSAASESFSLQHLSQSSMASGVSAASTADSTRALDDGDDDDDAASLTAESASVYNGSEDYAALDGESDYAAFYKAAAAAAAAVSAGSGTCDEEEEDTDADNVSVRSGASATSNSSSQAATLDYSVHSAHTSVGSVVTTPGSFPRRTTVSSTFDTDSDYVQVPYDRLGQLVTEVATPTAVPMATVTTVTRVGLAQSCQAAEATEPPPPPAPAAPTPASAPATDALRVVSVPAASAPPSSEAPARFITTRPLVTVFRAHASVAVRQTPSFAAPTVRRFRHGVVPRFVGSAPPAATLPKPKPLHAAAAGLELPAEPLLPVIRGNNYLDVRASQPVLPGAAQLYANLSSAMTLEAGQMYANLTDNSSPGVAVYMNRASSTPIEQFERQLLSDSDYVIYPLKDPAISRQEYMDAKDCSSLAIGDAATLPLPPPPPYRAPRAGLQYGSAANVANMATAAALYGSHPGSSASSLYSSLCSEGLGSLRGRPAQHRLSSHSLASTASRSGSWEPYSEVELFRARALAPSHARRATVTRAHSDDNLLSAASAEFLATCTLNGRPPPPYSSQARTPSSQHFSVSQTLPSQMMLQRQRRQQQQHQPQQLQHQEQKQALQQQQQQRQMQQLQQQQQKLMLQQEQRQQQAGVINQETLLKHQQLIRRHLEQRTQPAASPPPPPPPAAAAAIAAALSVDPRQAASATLPNPRTQARVAPAATQQQRRLLQQAQRQQQQQQIQRQQHAQRQQEQAQQKQRLQQQQQQQQQQQHRQQTQQQPVQQRPAVDSELDLDSLRAASQELDLPLISALFNDRLLRHSGPGRPQTWHEAASATLQSAPARPPAPAALQRLKSLGPSAFPRAQRSDALVPNDTAEGAAAPAGHAHSAVPAQLASAKAAGRRHLQAPAVR